MKIRRVGGESLHTEVQKDRQTDMKKLIAAFRNFANAPKNLLFPPRIRTPDRPGRSVFALQTTLAPSTPIQQLVKEYRISPSAHIFYPLPQPPVHITSKYSPEQINEIQSHIVFTGYSTEDSNIQNSVISSLQLIPLPPSRPLKFWRDASCNRSKTPALPSCFRVPLALASTVALFQLNTQGPGKTSQARVATCPLAATVLHDNNGLTLQVCAG